MCAEVEMQTNNKAYWFRLDENGEFVGGISKFLVERKDAVIEALGLKPGDFVGLTAGKKFKVIDDCSVSVIVPYDEDAKEMYIIIEGEEDKE